MAVLIRHLHDIKTVTPLGCSKQSRLHKRTFRFERRSEGRFDYFWSLAFKNRDVTAQDESDTFLIAPLLFNRIDRYHTRVRMF